MTRSAAAEHSLLTADDVLEAVFCCGSALVSNSACSVEYCSCGAFPACSGLEGLTDSGTLYGFLGLLFFAYHRE